MGVSRHVKKIGNNTVFTLNCYVKYKILYTLKKRKKPTGHIEKKILTELTGSIMEHMD